ncbi:MAG: hypothetical protein P8Y14_23050 [Anaerolineales bacterium]|jgi:hypothetical protein
MMHQKIEYIHHNPVRRGYVDESEHWRYSSARNYAGMVGLLEVTQEWRERCLAGDRREENPTLCVGFRI